ncbi:hypothetical protein [Sutcliffiella halmapala]|uniref:hypothetical protein n=1 Tax=Sutcliffiella halmapala TaxID=79882 RepID=UPI000994F640|nr:hypothetical protein [Sutcliffiella halmapala]
MVTAIVIPILIFYFYWITKKELAKQKQNWQTLEDIKHEARVEGSITNISIVKKRFYHQYYIMVTTLQIQNQTQIYTVIRKQPLTDSWEPMPLNQGDHIVVYGHWEEDFFVAGNIKKITQ